MNHLWSKHSHPMVIFLLLPLKQWHTGVFASEFAYIGYQSISKNMPYTMKPIEAVSLLPSGVEHLTKARHHSQESGPIIIIFI